MVPVRMRRAGVMAALMACALVRLPAAPLLFLSTQLTPLPEATMMREVVLADFHGQVEFEPYERAVFISRARDLVSAPGSAAVFGGLEADFLNLYREGMLSNVGGIAPRLSRRTFLPRFEGRGAFDSNGTYFVPWMQATYLMAASTQALKYLPKGADLNRLSYDELREWAAAMYRETGKGMLGFPLGPKGLMHRFLEGYLYPSFTSSMYARFDSPEAVTMWIYLRGLCQYVAQSSLILNRMDEALLNGEVWVAWDHSARLLDAFRTRPGQFVAFPAPAGPRGRGFIAVLAGLGVPKGSPPEAAADLIEFLTRPRTQARTMESVGFLPVVELGTETDLSSSLRSLVNAATEQLGARDGILSPVPVLAGDAGRRFDLAYLNAFSQIVLRARTPGPVLQEQGALLRGLLSLEPVREAERRGH